MNQNAITKRIRKSSKVETNDKQPMAQSKHNQFGQMSNIKFKA